MPVCPNNLVVPFRFDVVAEYMPIPNNVKELKQQQAVLFPTIWGQLNSVQELLICKIFCGVYKYCELT